MVFIFREHWAEISEALSRLTLGQGLLALAVGLSYPLLEGVSSWLIVRSRLSHFPLRQGIDNAWMGTFGNVVGLGAVDAVSDVVSPPGAGWTSAPAWLMTLQYVFHKTASCFTPPCCFWRAAPGWRPTPTACCGICPGPTLSWRASSWAHRLCALPVVQRLARWLLHFLPTRAAGPSAGKAGSSSWTP